MSQTTLSEIRSRVAEFGLDDSITPFVLEELRSIQEAKSIGSARGKPDAKKQQAIQTAHSGTRFVSSLRAHSKQAGKKLESLIKEFNRDVLALIKKYNTRKKIPVLDKGKPTGKFKLGDREIGFPKLKRQTTIMLKGASESAFQLGVKAAGIVKPNGALYPLTPHERKWLNSYLKTEIGYWNKMLRSLKEGQSDRKTIQRVASFSNSIRSVFESGRVLSVGPDVIIYWVLESNNPCPDCRLLHKYSPYTPDTLPTTPKAGDTRCLAHCYCSLRIDKEDPSKVNKVRRKAKSSSWVLKKIREQRKRK